MSEFFAENKLPGACPAPTKSNHRAIFLQRMLSIGLLCGVSSAAFAHPGHSESFAAAFAHPFTGVDHLLMMLFVGVWAGRSGGATRWLLPATFLLSMLGGWSLGASGLVIPAIESGVAATLIVLGVLFVLQKPMQVQSSRVAQMALVALFALLHGLAHGSELTTAWPSAAGMVLATALLHGFGLAAAALIPTRHSAIYRLAGAGLALIGGGLLATI